MKYLSIFCFTLLFTCISSKARIPDASSDSIRVVHSISASAGIDYIANSVIDELKIPVDPDDMVSSHSDIPATLRYSFSLTNPRIRNYYPGGYQGIGLTILNIGAANGGGVEKSCHYIGNPILVYIFQGAPFRKLSRNLSLDYEWNFGASFGWKPYGPDNYNFNLSVGSRVNAYLNISLFLNYKITPDFAIFGGVALNHFSNGNTSWPNPGINSLGARLGVIYTFNPLPGNKFPDAIPDTIRHKKPEYDISVWGAARKRVYKGGEEPVLLKGHFACAGISFAPMWRLNPWWRLGPSADIQYDQSSDKKSRYISGSTTDDIRFSSPDFFRQLSFGISGHAELQMPIFALNVGIGVNILAPWENRGTYQNITLKAYLTRNIFLNVGYQLRNFHQQAHLMLGLGTTI